MIITKGSPIGIISNRPDLKEDEIDLLTKLLS